MTPEVITALKRYEQVKLEIKDYELELDALKEVIIPHLSRDTAVETEQGKFTLSSRNKWKYSDTVTVAEESIKRQKKDEEARGIAVEIPGEPFIIYKQRS